MKMEGTTSASQPEAQSIREYGQWSVGFVARLGRYVAAPEVVRKHFSHGGDSGVHVFVAHDSFTVVKDEVPPATVDVAAQSETCHQRTTDYPMPQGDWKKFTGAVCELIFSHFGKKGANLNCALIGKNSPLQKVGGAGIILSSMRTRHSFQNHVELKRLVNLVPSVLYRESSCSA